MSEEKKDFSDQKSKGFEERNNCSDIIAFLKQLTVRI